MSKVKVKICCIQSFKEAQLAIKYGATAVGLVSEMPSGPGVISQSKIEEIAVQIPTGINTFLLTSKLNSEEIIAQIQNCKTNTVQLVDYVKLDVYQKIKRRFPHLQIVQVIHVKNEESINEALRIQKYVDSILLDSGNEKLVVKQLGGTGRTHNWKISKNIVSSVHVPVFLAGGLNSENISAAIKEVNPYGVDICSGVRTKGFLDENLLKEIFNKINNIN